MRIIDADKLISEVEKYKMTSGIANESTWNECVNTMLNAVNDAPTVEQPQAEWIVYNYPAHECTYCSNCKAEYDQIELYLGGTEYPSYCPSCGAKMTW